MRLLLLILLAAVALVAPPIHAADAERLSNIITEQRSIAARLDSGNTEGMKHKQVKTVRKNQKIVFDLAAGKQTLDQFNPKDRMRLKNALDAISAALVGTQKAENDQDYCWQERIVGTRVSKRRCGSERDRTAAREDAREYMLRGQHCASEPCSNSAIPRTVISSPR